jgi:hypothetical protein
MAGGAWRADWPLATIRPQVGQRTPVGQRSATIASCVTSGSGGPRFATSALTARELLTNHPAAERPRPQLPARPRMHSIDRLDRFHDLILQEIAKLAPETAEALTIRLGQLSSEWGG